VRRRARGLDLERPGGLALDDQGVVALPVDLPGLEAETGVPAGEALRVGERHRAPLLVVDEQHRRLGVQLRAPGQLAHHAERQRHAALHVDGPRADQSIPVAGERPVGVVGDDRVEVAEQQQAALAAAAQVSEQVGRVAGRGAVDPLGLRLGWQEGDAESDRLLRARNVARRR
jgi:hypothetical protein